MIGYDVTKLLQNGKNVINVMIGNGFYYVTPTRIFAHIWAHLPIGRPKMLAQLRIKYVDGSEKMVVSDTSWKMTQGPILFNSVYLGERYDACKELDGIDSPLFDDSTWKNVQPATSPGGQLTANILPPVIKDKILKPIRMTEAHPGVFVYDMGQNFSGTIRLRVKGSKGTVIRLRYGEDVYSDGSLNGMTSVAGQVKTVWGANREAEGLPQTCYQQDIYILKGEGEEIYEPRFTWHGFRYVEITGYPKRPDMDAIEGIQLHSDLERVGSFECSNELLNKIATAIDWTFLSNVFSVQSDCPHRKRLGYGGDLAATLDSYMYKFNMNNFYQNTIRNMKEARRPNGLFTEASPFPGFADHGFGQGSGPLGWQFGFCLTMDKLYEYYGNKRIIEQNYDTFKAQVDTLCKMRPKNLMTDNDCLGDHEALTYGGMDNTSFDIRCIRVSATAHYYEHAILLAKFAKLLKKQSDFQKYSKLSEDIKTAFIKAFVKDDGTVGNGSQSAMCFAMFYQLYPKEMEQKVFDKFIESISSADDHIHTGFFGTEMILQILSEHGRKDLAYKLATNTTFPSWGHMIQNGATTIWETWRYSDNVYSHNHPMFGTICEWYYRDLLGINSMKPGFKNFIVRPIIPEGLTYAKGTYNSVLGKIAVDWKKSDTQFTMKVTVPFGAEADIYVPDVRQSCGYEIRHVGSGNYEYIINN
ncbi:MAG: family 78 glycoside hydrolase catalytic domain [Phocaeicola sp.]|uniref:family 78 glycoside hydrolase catalytic domain n=1 Tax=Phocaeicola sp. TaxID=2773926 RepID=UPI003FA0FD20